MRGRAPAARRQEVALDERAPGLRGGLRGAVDELYPRARDAREERDEQRIVRAAEHDRVHLRVGEGLEILARDEARRLAVGPSLFHERDEERTRARDDARVRLDGVD